MAQDEVTNRRDFLRMSLETGLIFRFEGEDARYRGRTRNLSAAGLQFETEQPVTAGQVLVVSVRPANERLPPLRARLEVIRAEEESPGLFVVAGSLDAVR